MAAILHRAATRFGHGVEPLPGHQSSCAGSHIWSAYGLSFDFEELDFQRTPIGEVSLRRRAEPKLGGRIAYEVKLGDEFLMSSLFTTGEIALAELGLAAADITEPASLDVVVGGLGLGYTAQAALQNPAVRELLVIEVLAPVISWHERTLVPNGEALCGDPRCRLINADFFALAQAHGQGFDSSQPGRQFDAVLLDIDHSPYHLLSGPNAGLYTQIGLAGLKDHLKPGGVFAMWSNDRPATDFVEILTAVFTNAEAHLIKFPNPYTGIDASCTVYVAR